MVVLYFYRLDCGFTDFSICFVFQILSTYERAYGESKEKVCGNRFCYTYSGFYWGMNIVARSMDMGIPNLGFIATLFFTGFVGYAIVKYELFTFDEVLAVEQILSTMPDSLILADTKANILGVNDRLMNFVGYEKEELIGESIIKLCAENQEKTYMKIMDELAAENIISNYELVFKSKSGVRLNVLFSGSIIPNKRGRSIGMACIIHDITGMKQMEERLVK